MGYDTQIRVEGRGTIKIECGVFNNVLYVPSLADNVLFLYPMTYTGSRNRVVFGPKLVDILDI